VTAPHTEPEIDLPCSFAAYGLRILSDRELPGLLAIPSPKIPDIRVRTLYTTDTTPPATSRHDTLLDESPQLEREGESNYRICYPEGIAFRILYEGHRIEIRIAHRATLEDAATYLQGPVLGFVSRLRGW